MTIKPIEVKVEVTYVDDLNVKRFREAWKKAMEGVTQSWRVPIIDPKVLAAYNRIIFTPTKAVEVDDRRKAGRQ